VVSSTSIAGGTFPIFGFRLFRGSNPTCSTIAAASSAFPARRIPAAESKKVANMTTNGWLFRLVCPKIPHRLVFEVRQTNLWK
jgi:hypothetical protein